MKTMRKPTRRQIERKARQRAKLATTIAFGLLYASAATVISTGLIGFALSL